MVISAIGEEAKEDSSEAADNSSEADFLVGDKEEDNLGKRTTQMRKTHKCAQLREINPKMCNALIVEETTMLRVAPIAEVNEVVELGGQAQTELLATIEAVILVE